MFSKDVYQNRREKLRNIIKDGIVIILGNNESSMNYPDNTYKYRQDSNFLYFFGLDHPGYAGVLDIDANEDIMFGDDVDISDIIWMGPQPSVKEMASKVAISNTKSFSTLEAFVKDAISKGRKVHFLPPYRYDNIFMLEQLTGIHNTKIKENVSMELVHAVISLREVKEACEIIEIDKACNVGYEMHVAAMKNAKPGVVEQHIAGLIEGISLSNGGMPSFPIILSQHGETLHNYNHSNILTKGRMMLTDAGSEVSSHYASDFTRTVPVGGKFDQRQKDVYNSVLAANNHATSLIKAGVTYQSIHMEACKVLTSHLKDLGLMKGNIDDAVRAGAHAMFMPHGLGHQMGLDVHDMEDLGQVYVGYDNVTRPIDQFGTAYLRLGKELREGFVLTNEPGCYFIPALIDQWRAEKTNAEFINFDVAEKYKDFGGIRLEDDILVTKEGNRMMGDRRIPISVEEIEETMGM
ncbi:MAG: aminopeptidase P family protein [Marinifilaceae bacterium]